jgi:transcriptional regulator with XRE-family HTH domain
MNIEKWDRLIELRKEKGLKQNDVAIALGISRPAYSRWEEKTNKPSYPQLIALADFFDVSLDYLLGRSSKRDISQSDMRKIQEKLSEIEKIIKKEG